MSCPFSLLDEEPLLHVSIPLIQVHPVRPPRQPGLQLALPGQRFGQLACFENQPPTDFPSCSSKDRISCLWCSLKDAAPRGTLLSVWSEVA